MLGDRLLWFLSRCIFAIVKECVYTHDVSDWNEMVGMGWIWGEELEGVRVRLWMLGEMVLRCDHEGEFQGERRVD